MISVVAVPHPPDAKKLATYFKCYLHTPAETHKYKSKVVEEHGGEPFWDETIEYKYQDGDLIFIRSVLIRVGRSRIHVLNVGRWTGCVCSRTGGAKTRRLHRSQPS